MSTKSEIIKYSSPEDVPVLLWLFERYHWAREWAFVAKCNWVRYGVPSYESYRVWVPSIEGICIYKQMSKTA